jgi:hypothetical protein
MTGGGVAAMDGLVARCTKRLDVVLDNGSRFCADLETEERVEGHKTLYVLALSLKNLLRVLETDGILLHCFGASEDVYPSGMQVSAGGKKAYRMRLGAPTRRQDVVDIFASDDSVRPSTVEKQERFRERWLASLRARRIT